MCSCIRFKADDAEERISIEPFRSLSITYTHAGTEISAFSAVPAVMKGPLTILAVGLATLVLAPFSAAQAIQMGASAGYEYGSPLPLLAGYEPYSKNRVSLYTAEAFVGIPFGILNVPVVVVQHRSAQRTRQQSIG